MHNFFHRVHQAARRLVVQVAERQAEEDGEDEDLQDFIGRHRLEEILRENVGDEVLEVQRAGFQADGGTQLGQRYAQIGTRLQQVGED